MRLINKSISALALASMMGLWSCSQDEMLPGGETSLKGHSVPVTLTVSRGEAQTRTILSENTETGGLNDEWEENDVLHVYGGAESQNYGQKIGTLRLVEKIEPNVGVFTGELTLEEGEQSVSIWYHGDSENSDLLNIKENGYNRQELWVDLSNQNFKSVEALSAVDILSKTVTLKNYGDKVSVVKDEIMDAKLAMARFSLTGLPTGAVGTLKFQNIKQISSNIYDENRITYDNSTLGHMEFAFPERAITKDSY